MGQAWRPITDYETDPLMLEDRELRALSGVWIEQKSRIGDSPARDRFMQRLNREWAIETGLIERLYTLDRGVTELLIERGIDAALIPHRAAEDPQHAAALIVDQQEAIESVFSFVRGDRSLSTGYVKELHALFTHNQPFAEGRDHAGNRTRVPLVRGEYKKRPNNPTRPDGTVHAYCPPEHVAAEMDRLIELHGAHQAVPPEVEAAWLHHRFAQTHPFQDGNGRLARALATLVFVKHDWLPLVVRDNARGNYIDALEAADRGNLQPLVAFFAKLQRQEFVKALGIAHDVERELRVETRTQSMRRRFARRRDALAREWEQAKANATTLHGLAHRRLEDVARLLANAFSDQPEFRFFVDGDTDEGERSHFFQRQIVTTAKALGYYANTKHHRSWVRLVARDGSPGQILLSFHAIGHEFQGVLACSGTWFRRVQTEDGGSETEGETALSDVVFQINYREAPEEIESRFRDWLEGVVERGLALWESTAL